MKALVRLFFMLSAAAPPASAAEDAVDVERLLAGEVIAHESRNDGHGAAAHMEMLAHAPARAVWDVIVSCELAFAFVDGLQSCAVLEESESRALVRQVVDPGWLSPTFDYVFESLRSPYERIDVRLVEGNLSVLDAVWLFHDTADGTRVDYRVRIQPSTPAPRFLVRRNLRRGIPDMLSCIRGLAGGSGPEEQRQRDLRRCPGEVPTARRPE